MPWPRSGPAAAGTRGIRRIRQPSAFNPLVLLFAGEGEGGCVGKGRRLRPIGSSVDPSMQILDPEFEVRLVILPRHTIHSGGGFALKRVERRPERVDIDMVEERSELFLLPLPCG